MRRALLTSSALAALLVVSSFAYAQAPTDTDRNQPKNEKTEKSAPPKQQDRAAQPEQRRAAPEQKGTAQQAQRPQQKKPETTGQASEPAKSEQKPEQKADQHKERSKNAEERRQSEPKGAPARSNAQGAKEPDKSKTTATPSQQQKGATAPAQQQQQQKGAATPAPQNQQPAAAQAPQKQQPAAAQSTTPSPTTAQQPSSSTATTTNARGGTTTATSANQLPPQKQVQISETISRTRVAPPQRNLNVSIYIGTVVPQRVRFYPLPREIWSIEPAYRGYDYFTTEEDIVIIEPRSRRVVSMVPRDPSRARAQVSSTTSVAQGAGGTSMAQGAGGGGMQCQVMRRDPASGQLSEVRPSTVGAGGGNAPLSVTVQLSGGQMSPPVALDAPAGQIVVATQGNGDCQITIEPQPR